MSERSDLQLELVRAIAQHSALRGDTSDSLLTAAARCLREALGSPRVGIVHTPLVGEDLLVAHEIGLHLAIEEAALAEDPPDAPTAANAATRGAVPTATVDPDGSAWLTVDGVAGPIAALHLAAPDAGWEPDDLDFAAEVADELSRALLRHWTERQHRDRTDALLEAQRHTHVGCFEWDVIADKVRWSDELFRIYGNEPQAFEPTFEEFLERIHEDDRESVRASVYKAYEEKRDYRIEERIIRPDGSVRQLASWGHVIVDESSVPIKIIGSCQDVTDFRAAMAELAVTERRLAEVQERRARAMELNDNVVQGLAASLYALELGLADVAATELTGTLRSARAIIGDLLTSSDAEMDAIGLLRTEPAAAFLSEAETPAPAGAASPGATRVVIADDSSDIRWLTSMILSGEADFEVVAESADGTEVVAHVAAHHPDLVLLDLAMPVLDGLSAIPQIREASPGTVIVVFSGFNAGAAAAEAIGRGAHAYMEKGLIDISLPVTLRRILAQTAGSEPAVITGSDA